MSVVTVSMHGDVALVEINNPPVNATSRAVRQGLWDAVDRVQTARIAVLSCAGRTFIAGGDMSEFDGHALEPHLPDVVDAIESSKTPFIAALHGNVLGGGLEIAMACAVRIATPDTRFGLPEVTVGIIPGAGGSQRAPRLFGWDAAVDMACRGQVLSAQTALDLGAIDLISDDPSQAAKNWSGTRPPAVSTRSIASPAADWLDQTRDALARKARGQSAPLMNLDALTWASAAYSEGQPKERALHLEMRKSPESRALRHAFFAERQVARPSALSGGTAKEITSAAVVGGGLMGAGIAASLIMAGMSVAVIERDAAAAQEGHNRILGILDGALKRGKLDPSSFEACMQRLSAGQDYAAAAKVDLAIEAVFEDLAAKQSVFQKLANVVSVETILATNTSYLNPEGIFTDIEAPERCVGLHFFSPAHIMKLLEVVRLPETSANTLCTAFALAKRLRKVAVLSGICDGFIGNRILAATRRGAEYMLADGATPAQIDAAMRAFGMAMGPFEMQDMAGHQIAQANRRRLDASRPVQERYVDIPDQICALGRFGQRSGKGWYRYEANNRTPIEDPDVTKVIEAYSAEHGITRRAFSLEEIQAGLLAIMANEGARIVEEQIAEDDAAVDMVKLHGYGFPLWRGGPMHRTTTLGPDQIAKDLDVVMADSPGSWTRARRYSG